MDYEFYSDTGEAMVQLAFCRLMYNKTREQKGPVLVHELGKTVNP